MSWETILKRKKKDPEARYKQAKKIIFDRFGDMEYAMEEMQSEKEPHIEVSPYVEELRQKYSRHIKTIIDYESAKKSRKNKKKSPSKNERNTKRGQQFKL